MTTVLLCLALVLSFAAVELCYFNNPNLRSKDVVLLLFSLCLPIIVMTFAQKVIDNNLYLVITITSMFLVAIDMGRYYFLPDVFSPYLHFSVFMNAIPLFFIAYFRLVTQIICPDYPNIEKLPVIPLYSKGGATWKGKDAGYVLTRKDNYFGIALIVGFWIITFVMLFCGLVFAKF